MFSLVPYRRRSLALVVSDTRPAVSDTGRVLVVLSTCVALWPPVTVRESTSTLMKVMCEEDSSTCVLSATCSLLFHCCRITRKEGLYSFVKKNGGYLNRANSSCLMLKRGKFEGLSLSPAEIGHLP